jgi:hypothetical protein
MAFLNILTLIFVAAKLFEVITWSWWLVFLPSVVGIVVFLTLFFTAVWAANK